MFKKLFSKLKKNTTQKTDIKQSEDTNVGVESNKNIEKIDTDVISDVCIDEEVNKNVDSDIEKVNEDVIIEKIEDEIDVQEEKSDILASIEESIVNLEEEIKEDIAIDSIILEEPKEEDSIYIKEENEIIDTISTDKIINENIVTEDIESKIEEVSLKKTNINIEYEGLSKEDEEYIKEIKIKRGKTIKAIDVYTEEVIEFKSHHECSKKLKLPLDYIKENLKYGYTDYTGEAINYLQKELDIEDDVNYLDSNKLPMEILSNLNNKIFSSKISEEKRDEILCSDKLEPVKMHYKFECVDKEYDEYFIKYKSIIKRGGKKKVELVNKKGEVIEVFKSLDDCSVYLKKEKDEVVNMLKHFETKVGRNEIRYSLRNI